MLTNRHDVEQAINDAMFEEAATFGALGGSRFGAMTASTYGQAALQGRAIGGMLGGKDPRMRRQDLVDELMQEFPQPQTKDEFLATAKRAGELGLYEIQGQFLKVASDIPKKKIATEAQIDSLMGNLRLTQGADWMLDDYLIKNIVADFATYKEPEKSKYRTDVKAQFEDIINGYGAYLGTLDLEPSQIYDMMFTDKGKMQNIILFKEYLQPLSDANNMFATHLLNNNHVIQQMMENSNNGKGNGDTQTIIQGDGTDIVGDGTYLATLYNEGLGDKLVTEGEDRNDYDNLSEVARNNFNAARHLDVMTDLNNIYQNFIGKGYIENRKISESGGGGLVAEQNMTGIELNIENQDDAIQAWIHPWWEPTGVTTAFGDAMKYFMSKPPAEFEKFKKNPKKYFIENILRGQYYTIGKDEQWNTADDVLIDSETDIPLMWGMQD